MTINALVPPVSRKLNEVVAQVKVDEIQRFRWLESMALEVFKMPKSTPDEEVIAELKNRGIYYWNECITLMEGLDQKQQSTKDHKRNRAFIRYCKLRIKSYEVFCKKIAEHTDSYNDELAKYNSEINRLAEDIAANINSTSDTIEQTH